MFALMFALLPLFLPSAAFAATLEDAWAAAERGGTELRLLHEQTVQTETLKTQAWALLSPKLVLGASYTVNEYPIVINFADSLPESMAPFLEDVEPIIVNKKQYLQWNASVVQPLFSGVALPLFKGATETVLASRADERAGRAAVRLGIATAYYGVVVAREAEMVAENALQLARTYAELAAKQVDVGLAPPPAKLQAEIAVARGERERANARQGRVTAEEALSRLTGWEPGTPVVLPAPPVLPYADRGGASDRAQGHRPEIAAAEHQARAAALGRTAAGLDWLPTVDGRFTWSYNENSGFSDDMDMWQAVLTGNWVLWDGGARIAQQAKAASQRRMAQLAVERIRDTTTEEVRGLWEGYETAQVALHAVERERALATENLRLVEAGFTAGTTLFLEVEQARVGLRAAEIGALQQRMVQDLAALRLLAATGDL